MSATEVMTSHAPVERPAATAVGAVPFLGADKLVARRSGDALKWI